MIPILCGMPRCGKTTVGKLLAKQLNRQFIDTDDRIVDAYFLKTGLQLSCREIYKEIGEKSFRKIEKQQLASLSKTDPCVISLGGGALSDSANRDILKQLGFIVYLKADIDTLWNRLKQEAIPAFLDPAQPLQSLKDLASVRTPIYEMMAHAVLEIDHINPQQTVEVILKKLESPYGK